jgi:hypothetical protein
MTHVARALLIVAAILTVPFLIAGALSNLKGNSR